MYRMVISLILMLMVAIFSIQNKDVVFVNFLIWNIQIPLVILVISAVTLGAVMVGLLGIVKQISMGRRIRELNGKLKKAEGESSTLKSKLENAEKQIAESKAVLDPEAQKSEDSQNTSGPVVSEKDSKKPAQETILNPTIPFPKE
jgi:lipopolysaccharide assembly protein A